MYQYLNLEKDNNIDQHLAKHQLVLIKYIFNIKLEFLYGLWQFTL